MDEDDGEARRVVVLNPERPPLPQLGPYSTYTQELAEEICETLANSKLSVEALCEQMPGWPTPRTILRWRKAHPEFEEEFMVASECQCERMISETLKIASERKRDLIGNEKGQIPNAAAVQRDALMVKTIFEIVKKRHPYRWGDKLDINATIGAMSYADQVKSLK